MTAAFDVPGCPLAVQAETQPDAIAVMAGDLYWHYQALDHRVQLMACGLRSAGLNCGDVLVASGRNSPMLLVLILASLRAGVVILPVNPAFPSEKLNKVIALTGAVGLWTDDSSVCEGFTGIRLPIDLRAVRGADLSLAWDEQRVCNLVLTSGSSGFPKAAAHSFSCHRASAKASQHRIPLREKHSWLMSLPLYHIGGLATLFRCLLAGARIVFPDHRCDLATTLSRRQVSHVSVVNTQLYRLLRSEGFHFRNTAVEVLLVGGGYVAADLVEQCVSQNVGLLTTYGMTEMSSQICTGEPRFTENGAVTSGAPLPGVNVKVDSHGNILTKGKSLFCGYWEHGRPQRKVDEQGWFLTGDRGYWYHSESGSDAGRSHHLLITGRSDCQFISGGENIQPETIEKILLGLPDVTQAVVVPIADLEYGERPAAFICCQRGDFTPEIWQHKLRQHLPGFMVPDYFFAWPENNSFRGLKVNRRDLTRLAGQLVSHQSA